MAKPYADQELLRKHGNEVIEMYRSGLTAHDAWKVLTRRYPDIKVMSHQTVYNIIRSETSEEDVKLHAANRLHARFVRKLLTGLRSTMQLYIKKTYPDLTPEQRNFVGSTVADNIFETVLPSMYAGVSVADTVANAILADSAQKTAESDVEA